MPLLFTEFPASREMRNGRLALGRRWNMRLASGSCSYQVSRCYFLRVCVASKPLSFLPVAASGSNIVYFAYRPLLHFCPLRHTARIQLKSNAVSSLHWMKSLKFYQNIQTSYRGDDCTVSPNAAKYQVNKVATAHANRLLLQWPLITSSRKQNHQQRYTQWHSSSKYRVPLEFLFINCVKWILNFKLVIFN